MHINQSALCVQDKNGFSLLYTESNKVNWIAISKKSIILNGGFTAGFYHFFFKKTVKENEQDEIEFYSPYKRRMVDLDEAAVTTGIRRFF